MNQELSLHHRRRQPTPDELAGIPWLPLLQPVERERAVAALLVGDARAAVPLYDTTAIHAEAAVALALASD